ncbi:MAG: radical SAM protein [Okeania sp. SIO2F4]|uniref:radical SAM protein n=1 Tax=Okeania sp. SIO2F4 TaxID=2607790 RepID=UPI00142AED61|nr:radical SAM protein [Okeania sp. SIO2F4]NES03668.1 radical SAM protein [Okeania sp. SIO2F4]
MTKSTDEFIPVYGPVKSWRYGRSLGIDPIGKISTCSFNCVYCQLGEIEQKTSDRSIYVSSAEILLELQKFAPWNVDIITLSGSGEPTLALNLKDILKETKKLTNKPILVLTNGTTLTNPEVILALNLADKVSIKIDAVNQRQLQGINRPTEIFNLPGIWGGIQEFREKYQGQLAIQTMILSPWNSQTKAEYISSIKSLKPDEIQLNTPRRPKPLKHQLYARGNHTEFHPYAVQKLKCVSQDILQEFADYIYTNTNIPVRYKQK